MPRISAIALTVVGAIVAACSIPKAGDLGSAGAGGTGSKAGTGGTAIIGKHRRGRHGRARWLGRNEQSDRHRGNRLGRDWAEPREQAAAAGIGDIGGTTGTGGSWRPRGAPAPAGIAPAPEVPAGTGGSAGAGGSTGAQVSVDATGKYTVTFAHPAWTFGGTLGAAASAIMTTAGSDAVGPYRETTFSYTNAGTRNGRIRAYDQLPVVVFGETNPASGSNIRNFPVLSTLPTTSYHLAHQDIEFAPYTMSG